MLGVLLLEEWQGCVVQAGTVWAAAELVVHPAHLMLGPFVVAVGGAMLCCWLASCAMMLWLQSAVYLFVGMMLCIPHFL
jgi:hypothetical protein